MHQSCDKTIFRALAVDFLGIDPPSQPMIPGMPVTCIPDRFYVVIGIGTICSESGDTHPIWFIGLLEKGIRL